MQTYFIYALGDPRDGEVRYVGCSVNPVKRCKSYSSPLPMNLWCRDLKQRGLKPVLVILKTTEAPNTPRDLEAEWITGFIQRGHRLLNQQNRKGRRLVR